MRHGSLFSGIGGFDLAAEWMGWTNVFHCEWNEFGQRVLKHYWPDAISYGDITKTDFTVHRGDIDILTGGFPCQPYSMAGKRKGKEDERHLWPEMLRTIREVQPSWVVGENVPGIINWSRGLVFHEVQTELEAEGYEVFPVILPACGINAPHKRERTWFMAYSSGSRGAGVSTDEADRLYRDNIRTNSKILQNDTNSNCQGLQGEQKERNINKSKQESNKQFTRFLLPGWDNFPTQSPIYRRNDGIPDNLVGITFPKWRNESIKAMGNAIVPQVALQIFKAIEEFNNQTS
jgi:DNA (cytosine-5)-methyltransferase 1